MCFTIPTKVKKAKKATKDIICYKILDKNNNPIYNNLKIDGKIQKYQKGYIYEETDFNKLIKSTISKDRIRGKNGFHSYTEYSNYVINILKNKKAYRPNIVKMIIPKGAWYFENKYSCQYYSSKIYFP